MGKNKKEKRARRRERHQTFIAHIKQEQKNDEDTWMRNDAKSWSKNKKKKRKHKNLPREIEYQNFNKGSNSNQVLRWHKVCINVRSAVDKLFLLNSIGNYVDIAFCPLGFHRIENEISFYFERNKDVADAIGSLDKRLQTESGETMKIKVSLVENPELVLNAKQLEILKEAVLKRYNPGEQLLDLTSLHLDQAFVDENIFVPLSCPFILKQVIRIIMENFQPPNSIRALNLSKNKLDSSHVTLLQTLSIPTLKALSLENNNLTLHQCIRYIKMHALEELSIPLRLKDTPTSKPKKTMVAAVLKLVPTLTLVNGVAVSTLFKAAPESEIALSSLTITDFESKMRTFLEQYFQSFDTVGRPNLIQAYMESSKIEILSSIPSIPSTLFEKTTEIQCFLDSFPATKHVHSTFNLNTFDVQADNGCATIQGLCEISGIEKAVSFRRTMKIIAYNNGLCCNLDSLHIS